MRHREGYTPCAFFIWQLCNYNSHTRRGIHIYKNQYRDIVIPERRGSSQGEIKN